MLVSRETDYAIRIVRNLNHTDVKSIEEVASKELVTLPMAHKVCRRLKKKGIIQSKRGIDGGYSLVKPLEDISLFDVYAAMNDVVEINQCLADPESCVFAVNGICKVHNELNRIQNVVIEELKCKPMSELI